MDQFSTTDIMSDAEFRKLLDEWLIPMELENPQQAGHMAMDYTFDSSVLFREPESIPTQAEEPAAHTSTNVSHSQEALNSAKMVELEAKIQDLEGQIRALDNYIAELIPWTIEVSGKFSMILTKPNSE